MSLRDQVQSTLQNFDSISSDDFIHIVEQIKDNLKSSLTQEYLAGKISSIRTTESEEEKKNLCKNLKPYLDWYLSGP